MAARQIGPGDDGAGRSRIVVPFISGIADAKVAQEGQQSLKKSWPSCSMRCRSSPNLRAVEKTDC